MHFRYRALETYERFEENKNPPLGGAGSLESVAYEKQFLGMKS
jgi:hypothetical protein